MRLPTLLTGIDLRGYVLALVAVLIAFVVGAWQPAIFAPIPFLPFFAAVAVAARYGGVGPGLLATLIGGIGGAYLFVPPIGSIAVPSTVDALRLALYVSVAGLITALNHQFRSALAARDRAVAEAEKALDARDEFLSAAAHELKSPLTTLRGVSQLLLRRTAKTGELDTERTLRGLADIDRQSARLAILVEQLLDVTRLESGRFALTPIEVDLVALVGGVLDSQRAVYPERTLRLEVPEIALVRADPLRVEQVLNNLLDNARKFSPPATAIDVQVMLRDASSVVIAVRDRGQGVPLDQRARIFERYHQAQRRHPSGGFGLGLHISRQIAELHGGTLQLESPADGGARFVLTLPRQGPSSD